MAEIFLSYSRDDRRIMEVLRDNLRALGFTVWIDEEDLEVGTPDWEQAIEDAIRRVDAMVVVLSPSGKASEWVRNEIAMANLHKVGIFPALAYGDQLTAIPPSLIRAQYADMRGRSDFETEFRKLVDGLSGHTGQPIAAYTVDEVDDRPVVRVEVSGHVEGSLLVVGRDVAGDVKVAGRDIVVQPPASPPAGEVAAPPQPEVTPQPPEREAAGRDIGEQPPSAEVAAPPEPAVTPQPPDREVAEAERPVEEAVPQTAQEVLTPEPADASATVSQPDEEVDSEGEPLGIDFTTPLIVIGVAALTIFCCVVPYLKARYLIHPNAGELPVGDEAAFQLAVEGVSSNDAWQPVAREFGGVEMVLVPAGCFVMGSEEHGNDERPKSEQCFDQPFWIDRFEVTNAQYGSSGGHKGADRPRDNVTWADAVGYCADRGARLPTEAEWEYAARGPDELVYPWGNDYDGSLTRSGELLYSPVSVGSVPEGASWVGALDMAGNVGEWVSSKYWDYPYDPTDGRESETGSDERVVRGGGHSSPSPDLDAERTASRDSEAPDFTWGDLGFRCARDF